MSEKDSVVAELKSAAEWFTQHGRNTNKAIIGICKRAIDLINRQKAEIERLHKEHRLNLLTQLDIAEKIKAEAIKEFAEKLKEYTYDGGPHPTVWDEFAYAVDNLVAEMVGDSNAE